jgi:putative ABC transport system permease protein
MDARISLSVAGRRFNMILLLSFAAAAVLLAAVGVYGVMALAVGRRTREIGIRIALGARPSDVRRLIVGDGAVLALAGVAFGLGTAAAMSRLLSGLLFGVGPLDAPTFIAVPLFLGSVALLACYLPARRASKVDPNLALKTE